jgi:serine O-acetyltransferase
MANKHFLRLLKRRLSWINSSGRQALTIYRISHSLSKQPYLRWLALFMSRVNLFFTGADISPDCVIESKVVICHSVGVVIGATAIVRSRVVIMQGVTLGAHYPAIPGKRHPTIESGVLLGAHCVVLGDITIGAQSRIGANATVLEHVPAGSTVVGQKSIIIRKISNDDNTFKKQRVRA